MADDKLPATVRNFLERHIASVEQLEILLFLVKSSPKAHTPLEVYKTILSSKESVHGWLEHMVSQHLIVGSSTEPGAYGYEELSPDTHSAIVDLAEAYKAFPVRVIEVIYGRDRPNKPNPAQGFADAFRLRKN